MPGPHKPGTPPSAHRETMYCRCRTKIGARAKSECRRLRIPYCCSRCLCDFLMPATERQRRKRLLKQRYECRRVPRLVARLTPIQMALFERWKRACAVVGVEATPEAKLEWLTDVLADDWRVAA